MAGLGAKLWTVGEVATAANINGYLMDQTVMKFADTTARDAAFGGAGEPVLSEGMFAYTSDTNTLWFYTGAAWEVATIKPSVIDAKGDLLAGTAADTVGRLAVGTNGQMLIADSGETNGIKWVAGGGAAITYTPTWTGTGGTPTLGNGTLVGAYQQVNKLVFYRLRLTWGSTTSAAGITEWRFSLPITSTGHATFGAVGFATVLDSGTAVYRGVAYISTASTVGVQASDGVSSIGVSVPFTWTTSDAVQVSGFYEVA
jgi:hypothetical protein